jgi:outer membrane protein TolC
VFDYGIQEQSFRFTAESDYWMAALVLEWQLFDGYGNAARKKRVEYEREQLRTGLEELVTHVRLKVQEAYRAVIVAGKTIQSSGERLAAEKKSFEIIRKKYENGLVSQIEFIETRTSLTDAEVHHILYRYDYHIRLAELEEAAALFDRWPVRREK